uniref:Beta-glucuronidase n=1 Tax=Ciona intestinalis TaxID=7719 RepID=H2XR42_CIOIN
ISLTLYRLHAGAHCFLFISIIAIVCVIIHSANGILYPMESESRQVKDLSGRWRFRTDNSSGRDTGFQERWWERRLAETGHVIDMPVPASYNDITQDKSIRDFVGWAWYETTFFAPNAWNNEVTNVWLRVGSAHYYAMVWLNGEQVMEHEGGHLPFECDVTMSLNFGATNRLTIAVNNTLTPNTLPPGEINHYNGKDDYPAGYFTQEYEFDFFNYAGIHRPVKLYTTPRLRIGEIVTSSDVTADHASATVHYQVTVTDSSRVGQEMASYNITVVLEDSTGAIVNKTSGGSGSITVTQPMLWWPVGMHDQVGYLYTMVVYAGRLGLSAPITTDVYRLKIGIRTVTVDQTLKINGRPFYVIGVGKHEDWDVRGKGFDWSMVVKDFNLLDWLGANAFRTSHYPYAEEIMQMCDERGIVVIDECPAVGMRSANNFVNKTLSHHLNVIGELVTRDRNHPSVIMWSVANEPSSQLPPAAQYFKTVLDRARELDPTRPATFVCNAGYDSDLATPYVDVVCVNKYEGWYDDPGHVEVIQKRLSYFLTQWHEKRSKPVIHMEWGAGAIAGFHSDPSLMYTEEYLCDVMREHFATFDSLRTGSNPVLAGEMIWNFADFATAQATTRAYGNRKGIFTRQRQPKSPAFVIRDRYRALRNQSVAERQTELDLIGKHWWREVRENWDRSL